MHASYPNSLTPRSSSEHQSPEPENPKPRVTVVVVSHNRQAMLRACLEALEKSEGREKLQIVVVDNGSVDGSAQLDSDFPDLQWIRLPKNFGLTKAMNLGWRAADADYVFFLHDDTEVPPDAAMRLADALDANPDAAAVCPLLVDREGRPAPQFGSLPLDGQLASGAAIGRCARSGGVPARRRADGARVLHQGDAPDRRAFRTVRRRCRSRGAVPPRAEEGVARAGCARVPFGRATNTIPWSAPTCCWRTPRSWASIADSCQAQWRAWRRSLARCSASVSASCGYTLSGQKIDGTAMNQAALFAALLLTAPLAAKTYPRRRNRSRGLTLQPEPCWFRTARSIVIWPP